MRDVLYALIQKNEEYLDSTKFINLSKPESDGSLIVNLLYLRETYDSLLNKEDITYHEKLIYRGKYIAVTEIIKKVIYMKIIMMNLLIMVKRLKKYFI